MAHILVNDLKDDTVFHMPTFFTKVSLNALMRDIHIYSAMLVLLLMLFFSVSGFFLAHPALIQTSKPTAEQVISAPLWLNKAEHWEAQYTQHGLKLMLWLDNHLDVRAVDYEFEWDEIDNLLIINLQGPNGNTLVEYFINEAEIVIQQQSFGFLEMLNNVHRAKHTNLLWKYLSDISAIVMLFFCFSGLWLALIHKQTRRASSQWLVAGSSIFIFVLYLMH